PPIPPLRPASRWHDWLRRLAVPLAAVAALAGGAWYVLGPRPATATSAKLSDPKAAGQPTALPVVTNSIGMRLARVPAGDFVMGDAVIADARPHIVRISRGFLIGVHEVTQQEYQAVTGDNPSGVRGTGMPVESVTWEDA